MFGGDFWKQFLDALGRVRISGDGRDRPLRVLASALHEMRGDELFQSIAGQVASAPISYVLPHMIFWTSLILCFCIGQRSHQCLQYNNTPQHQGERARSLMDSDADVDPRRCPPARRSCGWS